MNWMGIVVFAVAALFVGMRSSVDFRSCFMPHARGSAPI